jgi:hypothetical protein
VPGTTAPNVNDEAHELWIAEKSKTIPNVPIIDDLNVLISNLKSVYTISIYI